MFPGVAADVAGGAETTYWEGILDSRALNMLFSEVCITSRKNKKAMVFSMAQENPHCTLFSTIIVFSSHVS